MAIGTSTSVNYVNLYNDSALLAFKGIEIAPFWISKDMFPSKDIYAYTIIKLEEICPPSRANWQIFVVQRLVQIYSLRIN